MFALAIWTLSLSAAPMAASTHQPAMLQPTPLFAALGVSRLSGPPRSRGARDPRGRKHRPAQSGSSRDSLKNGTIIGAAVGAIALGAFGAFLCNALQEPGDPSCLTGTLRIAALGAAVGAGAGLAIDAARSRGPGVTLSMKLRF
jgi:hypothetical protein